MIDKTQKKLSRCTFIMHFIEKRKHINENKIEFKIFVIPNPTTMSNLRVSCHKISMYLFILCIILACSNDIDVLTDAVLNEPAASIEERQNSASENPENNPAETPAEESDIEDGFEGRITEFPPVDDAYVQSGKGI